MKKIALITSAVLMAGTILGGYFLYNKPHMNIRKGAIDYSLSPDQLTTEFLNDRETANRKFNEKIILISGTFRSHSVSPNGLINIIISGNRTVASCEMDSLYTHPDEVQSFAEGNTIQIKGLLVGFDDLLGEIQLKNCLLVKQNPNNH